MANAINGILGVIAIAASFGATQLASGDEGRTTGTNVHPASNTASTINRSAKGDRPAQIAAAQTAYTVSIRSDVEAASSILLRVPTASAAEPSRLPNAPGRRAPGRSTVACEGTVSVLTDVAKVLQPGRCIT